MYDHKALCRGVAAALLISASAGLHAAPTTYNYTLTGDVLLGAELSPNLFGLSGNFGDPGDTITAYGSFTVDDSFAASGGTVSFEAGSGNTMTLDLNGTLLFASDAASYPAGGAVGPELTFTAGWTLFDFYYDGASFYSSFTQFDDMDGMYGEWRTDAMVAVVPEAKTYAMMMAGLGLIGFMGMARKKALQATA